MIARIVCPLLLYRCMPKPAQMVSGFTVPTVRPRRSMNRVGTPVIASGPFGSAGFDRLAVALVPEDVGVHERLVHHVLAEQDVRQVQRQGEVAPRPRLDQQLGPFGRLGAAGIHHHDPGSCRYGLLDEGHLMDVGLCRILASQQDEPGIGQVPWRAVLVRSQRQTGGFEARGPAKVAVRRGIASKETPERGADAVKQSLRATAAVVEKALAARGGSL
jgi:hypothetical protein